MKHFLFSNIRVRRLFYRLALFVGDAFLVYVSFRAAFFVRFQFEPFLRVLPAIKGIPPPALYHPLQITALAVWMASFIYFGFYERLVMGGLDELLRVVKGVLFGWMLILAGTFMYREVEYSRLVLVLSGGFSMLFIFLFRETAKALYDQVAAKLWEPHMVLVLGSGRMAKSIRAVLERHREFSLLCKNPQTAEELKKFLEKNTVREVFMGDPNLDHETLIKMTEVCDERDIPLKIVPDVLELRMGEVIFDDSLGFPTYRVKPISLHGWTYLYKRFFDVVLSVFTLSVTFFPLAFISLLIWLDSKGSILYQQPRMGHRRKIFDFFKFRTMVADADAHLEELKKNSERMGPVFKMKNDPRVTWVGRYLRKYSVDEVPQILNVLRGEMSLVGPRPQVLWEAAAYDDWAKKRLNVLPGITGLWQVSGRASLSYEQMIELDIFYIEHWSPGLDLKIILETIPTIFGAYGAY